MPQPKKPKKAKKLYRFMPLPPGFCPVDATIEEVASFRREGRWTVHQKIRTGVYQSYLDGRIRKIIFASVLADRARTIAEAGGKKKPAVKQPEKRKPGRPRKAKAEQAVSAE
jgi:hypothetical protein